MQAYLVIVRRSEDGWVVDEDSYHVLDGRGSDVLELTVRAIRPLAPTSKKKEYNDQGKPVDVFS